jgi:hypothetical protein
LILLQTCNPISDIDLPICSAKIIIFYEQTAGSSAETNPCLLAKKPQ